MNKMESGKIVGNLREYPIGTVFKMSWDRGNGVLSGEYILLGFNDEGRPTLKKYHECGDSNSYSNIPPFDILNPEISIMGLEKITHVPVK